MKKCYIVLMAGIVLAVGGAWADAETIGGYTWTYRINGDTAEIYKGSSAAISPKPTGLVTIPSTLGGKSVTGIGGRAFYGCNSMTWVTIPDSVTDIGNQAFYGCSSLTIMTIPNSVTNIGERAFYNCSKLTWVTIPDGIKDINEYAFYGCKVLASITIPDSVTGIGNHAFYNCSGLTSVMIGNGVMKIGKNAFYGCRELVEFEVSAENPFYKSVSGLLLTKDGTTLVGGVNGDVVVPDGVTSIGDRSFRGLRLLTSVTIPVSVTRIGTGVFYGCSKLVEFVVADDNPAYKSASGLLLTKDGKTLVEGVNGDVVIPDGVTSIGDYAFSGCSGLTSVTIPESVTSIGKLAFYNCSGLTNMTIPDGVVDVADDAFEGCDGLPANVKYGGIVGDVQFGKAQKKVGTLYDATDALVGTVELKFSKKSKKGGVKLSATATLLIDGKSKKIIAKAISPRVENGRLSTMLAFGTPINDMAFEMDAESGVFTLINADYEMVGAVSHSFTPVPPRVISVGGALAKEQMAFNVLMDPVPNFGKDGVLLEEALPVNVPVYVADGKEWSFDKASSLKYKKNNGVYGLAGLNDSKKPNRSGLKLTYTANTGMFKGAFKLYATNAAKTPEGKVPKLKKFTVNVIGFVVDGVGYGWATLKKPNFTWSVKVE